MSHYGTWITCDDLPAFRIEAEQYETAASSHHWVMLGNRRIKFCAVCAGSVGVFDESSGLRWLTAPFPEGTGYSLIEEGSGLRWGPARTTLPAQALPQYTFGATWFELRAQYEGLSVERTFLCPEGDIPWLLIRVHLVNASRSVRTIRHIEQWTLRPQFLNLLGTPALRQFQAQHALSYQIEELPGGYRLREQRRAVSHAPDPAIFPALGEVEVLLRSLGIERLSDLDAASLFAPTFGPPLTLRLETLGNSSLPVQCVSDGATLPRLELSTSLLLEPGSEQDLWFRFGCEDGQEIVEPTVLFQQSLQQLRERLPRASAAQATQAEREIPWHSALLSGGACRDLVLGEYTLNQASAYSFSMGFNGAARDQLQHALPLVYSEPDLALAVLRNTCSWATPEGDLPYGLDGSKRPWMTLFQPSDQNLWAFWLAAEYALATGDVQAFEQPLAYHPIYQTPAVPLREHLRRQYRFFADSIGRGEHGHVRMRNADWNDTAVVQSGVTRAVMTASGESVLNSALAAWVLEPFAALCQKLGDTRLAAEAVALAAELRHAVATAWNGSWFDRAYAPAQPSIGGPESCWLEVQPWAMLCGAADEAQARVLLAFLEQGPRADSPLGTRLRWPLPTIDAHLRGEGTMGGGIWFAINMALVWALARYDSAAAWDEWRRMTLAAHTAAYPQIWEGTLSGPDSYNAPESQQAGHTWKAMQVFPVNNLHSHAQPLLAYLRLLGIEPSGAGALKIGSGAAYRSKILRIDPDGHGSLLARGPVILETTYGVVHGGPGEVSW